MTSNVVVTFIAYRTKRNELKKKFREQLEAELAPYLKAFGEAVAEEQGTGKSVDDIEDLIGVRNRNLIYAAKRAAKGFAPSPGTDTPDPTAEAADAPAEGRVEVLSVPNDGFEVYIDQKFKGSVFPDEDGLFDLPEEWALDAANRGLYREAIEEIRRRPKE